MVNQADICLVYMPFGLARSPSFALGLLKAAAQKAGIKVAVEYGNLHFAKYLDSLGENISQWEMLFVSWHLALETIFQPYAGYASYVSVQDTINMLCNLYQTETYRNLKRLCEKTSSGLEDYLDQMVDRVLAHKPKLVGCTYNFQQCNAILSLFKKIKERDPNVITAIGGCGVTTNAGPALLDYMPQIDYAFLGESDDIFADACRLIMSHDEKTLFERYDCVIKKGISGRPHAVKNLNQLPYPDYDDYFQALEETGLNEKLDVLLLAEASRGCWWGCKRRCGFCGLHSSDEVIVYRKKDSIRFAEELKYLSEQYNIKNYLLTDCILDPSHVQELPELLKDENYKIIAEVKTNLSREQILGLRQAGFVQLQPGIESLSDNLLQLMHKGNTAIKNIEFLKNCAIAKILPHWNMLWRHPIEEPATYYEMIDIMECLHHLYPPNHNPVIYQRKSEYTTNRENYGLTLKIASYYPYFFGQNMEFLERFAENFESVDSGDLSYVPDFTNAISLWKAEYENAVLYYVIQNDLMGIVDTRKCARQKRYAFDGVDKKICELTDRVISEKALFEQLSLSYTEQQIKESIAMLLDCKLLVKIRDEYLFLAVPR